MKINEKGDPKDACILQVLRAKGSRDSGARAFRAIGQEQEAGAGYLPRPSPTGA